VVDPFAPASAAPAQPAAPVEDPFAIPAVPATPVVPAVPTTEASLDDIFGPAVTPPAQSPQPQPNAFTPPAAPAQTQRDDFLDLLTTAPAAQPAAAPAQSDDSPATDASDDASEKAKSDESKNAEDNDRASTVEPADPLAGSPMRLWHDNTGNFEVMGRLVVVRPDQVRLLKENGRFTTVPLRRLSAEDRKYVELTLARIERDHTQLITAE
jgi:hypothetical protein